MGDASSGDDLAQETLLQAQQSIGRLGEPYRFGPWLFAIAANLARKAWRAEARRPLSLENLISAYPHVPWDESLTAVASPEQLSEEAEESRLLAAAIEALPLSLGRVVVLYYVDGLNYAEVAATLAVPISTVKGRLFESRARLRRELRTGRFGGLPDDPGLRLESAPSSLRHPTARREVAGSRRIDSRQSDREGGTARMGASVADTQRHIRVVVHLKPLIDQAHRFVSAAWPRSAPVAALGDLAASRNRCLRIPVDVLEQMVLAGVTRRQDVAEFVTACFPPDEFEVQ
jgi:RNA polymerase sigma-70 factor (ECF subfamily)